MFDLASSNLPKMRDKVEMKSEAEDVSLRIARNRPEFQDVQKSFVQPTRGINSSVKDVVDEILKSATRGAEEGMDDTAEGIAEVVKDAAGSVDIAFSSKDPTYEVQAADNNTTDAN